MSVWVRLEARLRFVRWVPGFVLIGVLLGRSMRVENSVVFMCHVARVVVVLGLSDVQMKMKRRGEGHCPWQGNADDQPLAGQRRRSRPLPSAASLHSP